MKVLKEKMVVLSLNASHLNVEVLSIGTFAIIAGLS
jgi:hypothetical protein